MNAMTLISYPQMPYAVTYKQGRAGQGSETCLHTTVPSHDSQDLGSNASVTALLLAVLSA